MTDPVTTQPETLSSPEPRINPVITYFRTSNIMSIIGFVVLMLAWEASCRVFRVPQFILPAPSAIGLTIVSDFTSGLIFEHFLVTMNEVLLGFVFAVTLGVALGSAIALVPMVERVVYPYVLALQTVPKIAIAPLMIIWLGFGIQSKVVTAMMIAFFPILVNVVAGLKTVEPRRILLMRALRASRWETFRKVRFPSMLPYLFAGMEVGIIFSVTGAIVAEFIGSSEGLGSLIIRRQAVIDVPGVFSVLVYLSLLGLALNLALRMITRRFAFWSRNVDVAAG